LIFSALAISLIVAYWPVSSIFCHRKARATALTSVLSTWGLARGRAPKPACDPLVSEVSVAEPSAPEVLLSVASGPQRPAVLQWELVPQAPLLVPVARPAELPANSGTLDITGPVTGIGALNIFGDNAQGARGANIRRELVQRDQIEGFHKGDPCGIAFADARLAAGATAVLVMTVNAWRDGAQTPIGYPMVNVRDIESGKVRATRDLFGAD
jgi:hypothetical protein